MRRNKFLFIGLGLISQNVFCQTLLKGEIISDAIHMEGVEVVNVSGKTKTVSGNNGSFSIVAKPSDTLTFYGIQVEGIRMVLKPSDFSETPLIIRLKQKVNQLDEIYIENHPEINAVSLGIIPGNTKSYTPAERRLKTAGDFKPIHLLGLLGGSLPVDPIINKISGRTAMLKKELEIEKKEKGKEKLSGMYEEAFFVEKLKIPREYIQGFQIYALDDKKLEQALKSNNRVLTTFLLGELAEKYKLMVFPEKN